MNEHEKYTLLSQHFKKIDFLTIQSNIIGQKAIGLICLPPSLTLPFFVLKSSLFKIWLNNSQQAEEILERLINHAIPFFSNSETAKFIIRSSAKIETFEERGFYKSSRGNIKAENLADSILILWKQNLPNFNKYEDNEFATIVQLFVKPKISGHLSNERRISRNKVGWLIEMVNQHKEFLESKKFISKEEDKISDDLNLNCTNKKDLIKKLKLLAYTISIKKQRTHIEWAWDGNKLWIVQNDLEQEEFAGSVPGSEWKRTKNILNTKDLTYFTTVTTIKNDWEKIKCIKTFIECNLPYGEVYVLENENVINKLQEHQVESLLEEDLKWLLSYPIVIRMDVKKTDGINNILLPRTETLFTVGEAKEFLITNAKIFFHQGLSGKEFCFLIHRFIISKSCALAFSRPNIQKARIDSTWGIVDGLYYHPHDSFEVNLINKLPQIKKQIRCKTEYLDVDASGKWFSKRSGIKWDWAESLSKKQILTIAQYNTIISDHLDSPVTVMYFVDIDNSTGYSSILPWFYTTEEIADSSEKFTDVIFSDHRELIQNEEDFNIIQSKIEQQNISKITLKLKLNPDILRDKPLIEKIGRIAQKKNIPIELEGSILSHTYYILRKMSARVKCVDPFEPKYKKQKFYKLVRDKIPINIESKGEKARTVKVNPNELLKFLKKKAIEEAYEFYWESEDDNIIEELADLYEVIRASCKIFNIKIDELEKIADKKIEKKGGFETGVVLVDTTESSLIDVVDSRGESLLINNLEQSKKLSSFKVRKSNLKKIGIGLDNSITLPYIIDGKNTSANDFDAPVILDAVISINISYTTKGIKIKFIKSVDDNSQSSQLDLFA